MDNSHEQVKARGVSSCAVDSLPMLENVCDRCEGRGWRDIGEGREQCGSCCGAGFVATKAVKQILSLVKHNLLPILQQLGFRDGICSR
jgi:hypothetical protein